MELFGEKTMWMWLSVFHLIYKVWDVERIGSGTMWVWMMNPCIPHWKSYNKEKMKEGSVCFCCLLWIFHRDAKARWHTDYWFNEADAGLQGGMETAGLDEDDWLLVWIFGDSTGSREWSHLNGWMVENWNDGGKVDGLSEWGDRFDVAWFRCDFHC